REAPEDDRRQQRPVLLGRDAREENLAGPEREERAREDAPLEREDRPPEQKRREREQPRRDRRGGPPPPRHARGKEPEETREDQGKPGGELHPVPAGHREALVPESHAEEDEASEVGQRLGRVERDDEEPQSHAGENESGRGGRFF